MLPREDNNLLTQTGPDKPMGKLMRRYWIPALLSKEIAERDGPPVRVRLLGEDLVAFRDSQGQRRSPGRTLLPPRHFAFFGRNEECGLRCIYHGWKYDTDGNVLETPAEPEGSTLKDKVHHNRLSVQRSGGDCVELSRTEG